ncbi:hypothetical protein [Dactylosporangium sp. NPDC049140]|uniref:hypothetical protein n=1 Tax=Dactylosporangium sp. NPDC049140 TaxID=3155647 RepID=UPI0033C7A5E2
MYPPHGAAGSLLAPADAVDIPVFLRRSAPLTPQRRPRAERIDATAPPWPTGTEPPDGQYLVRTTWREIIDAAVTVGRDPTAWLAATPTLAWAELVARRSPLMAYLGRTRHDIIPGAAVYHLEPNVIYQYGTEVSAQVGFGYRMGMTMAEWASRGLLGTGPTDHAESVAAPVAAGLGWTPQDGLPDLLAHHPASPHPWLIEAKGGRRAGLTVLRKGAHQLSRAGLMAGPHVRLLCGTSLEHRVFVTLDLEVVDGGGVITAANPGPDDADPETILDLARSRMLFYLALHALPPDRLRVTPIGADLGSYRMGRGAALAQLLEADPSTVVERAAARNLAQYRRRPPQHRAEMITARVPGTDLIVGLSRRLYAACEQLAAEQMRLALSIDVELPLPMAPADIESDLRFVDERRQEREALLRLRERQERRYLAKRAVAGFRRGSTAEWAELVGGDPPLQVEPPIGYLEAATPDTYLAVSAASTTTLP